MLDIVRKKTKKYRKVRHWASLVWGLSECCQTTATPCCWRILRRIRRHYATCFLVSKDTRISRHAEVRCGKFLKTLQWQQPPRRRSLLSLFGRHEQSDILKQAGPWAQNVSRCVSSAKGCLSVNFPVLFCVSEIVRFSTNIWQLQLLSTTSPVRKKVNLTKVRMEVVPCEEWLRDEVELNTAAGKGGRSTLTHSSNWTLRHRVH